MACKVSGAEGGIVFRAKTHGNHPFCSLRGPDYNGKAARPLIMEGQQDINRTYHLLGRALVGCLLEIY